MKGTVVVAAAAAIAALFAGAEGAQPDASQGDGASATVTTQRGTTEALLLDATQWENTEVGRLYVSGSEFRTGTRSYIEVSLDENNSFRIKGTTRVKVSKILDASTDVSGKVVRLVELQVIDGEVNARLNRLPDDVRVKVSTPTAVAGTTGTGFTVGFRKAERLTLVTVIESNVLVEALDRADKTIIVNALEQVEVRSWKGGKITATGRGVLSEKLLGKDFVEKFHRRAEKLAVVATGTGHAPEDVAERDERRAESEAAAHDAAHAALSAVVLQLVVNESTTVSDLLAKDNALAAKVYEIIAAASAAETTFAADDSCTVTVQADITAIGEVLGRKLVATIASVREIPKAAYLKKFGARALNTTKRAAETDAQRRLAGKINGSIIKRGSTLEDEADRNAQVRATILGVVQGAIVEEERYFSDGSVAVLMSCMLGQIAENHGEIVGETFLSSPAPAVIHDFMDYRMMRQLAAIAPGQDAGKGARVVEEKKKTQGDLAQEIVRMLGLDSELPPDATELDYIGFLRDRGVRPLPDWRPDEEANEEVLAVVIVQVLGWLSEVEDPTNPDDYIALLEERGLILTSVRGMLGDIEVVNLLVQTTHGTSLGGLYEDNLSSIRGR